MENATAETEVTYRIELYEIIGDGGRYFSITVRAYSPAGAMAAMRKTYEPGRYCVASKANPV